MRLDQHSNRSRCRRNGHVCRPFYMKQTGPIYLAGKKNVFKQTEMVYFLCLCTESSAILLQLQTTYQLIINPTQKLQNTYLHTSPTAKLNIILATRSTSIAKNVLENLHILQPFQLFSQNNANNCLRSAYVKLNCCTFVCPFLFHKVFTVYLTIFIML